MSVISPFERFKIAVVGAPEKRRTRCWIFHDWSRWKMVREGEVADLSGRTLGYYKDQERACETCGMIQARHIRT